ncbi:MAG: glycosyltransferase family 2 protein [Prevotella sp.]|nr:glycosyltransferase family A protein [Prevotella sp.]MCH3993389.1 glycosyltransferase family 2 protein [Prevotella sp.]MCI1474423.1 glycosyltransferase family 2 protein [Prevotella sp.]MCI1549071.1 glycosyltransferase family 2 protein [Prevotella sp.]
MNSTNPTISIIIPVYNTEKYLRHCLDSVLAQTYKDFECILVDDGSTDDSGKICDEYMFKDERLKVFHKKNGGASSARNVGLDNAEGKYITFCDADDYVESNWLSVFMSNIKDYDIVISSISQNQDSIITKRIFPYNIHEIDLTWAILRLEGAPGFLWNKCFKNDIIRKNHLRFNENYKIWEDEEFVSHYFMYAKCATMTSEVTYNYFAPNYDVKYNKLQNINTLFDIYNHTKNFLSINGTLCHIYYLYIERMLSCVRTYYYLKEYKLAFTSLQAVTKIAKEVKVGGLSKMEKFLSRTHPVISHFFYITLSSINKL